MMLRSPLLGLASCAVLAFALAACQGNIGSGSGLSIPQGPQQYQPGGPQAQTASRERVLEGAVYLNPAAPPSDIPLPTVNGFAIDIKLGTAPPTAAPTPTPTATAPAPKRSAGHRTHTAAIVQRSIVLALASGAPASPTSADLAASAAPSPAPLESSAGVTHLSDVPSPSVSGSPVAAGSAGPSVVASASPLGHHPHSTATSGPKVATKLVAYPDDAPVAPTAEPTGSVQTFPNRKALVRGYLMSAADVPIYGLGAIKFTVPPSELSPTRGYTIAIFTSQKKHRGKLLEYDTAPVALAGVIASSFDDDPIVFKKSIGYEIVLYADQAPATPIPVPSGYPAAGNNPVPYPSGATPQPGQSLQPGQTPIPQGYPTPTPLQTFFH
jgi:hypothetical protein